MGITVFPRTDKRLGRGLHLRGKGGWRIHIGIGPASDRKHRRLDRRPVLADRSMFPEIIPPTMTQPVRRHERQRFDPLHPGRAPVGAQLGIQRAGLVGVHLRRPIGIVAQQAAAHEMDIIGIAVHG